MVAGGVSSEFQITSAGITKSVDVLGAPHLPKTLPIVLDSKLQQVYWKCNSDETGVTVIPVVGFCALKARAPCLKSGGRLKLRHGHIARRPGRDLRS
ncbi:hypothetical protein PGTUg99_027563 [Puccinia graminis f. sp. tritici]|uniref:Uncharacterized protein n=1 Tax=Puccinia graminis f. sp. tritici TaxID=56615 RepID=A0A5B0SJA4_PUCGR|nr:hypothetical protein PGTUg99_027563 [Puccinia graminis f. sp. tritici]